MKMYFLFNMGILCIPGTSPRGTCNSASESSDMRALNMGIFQPAMLGYQRVSFSWGIPRNYAELRIALLNNISLTWRPTPSMFVPTKYWWSEIPFPESQSKKRITPKIINKHLHPPGLSLLRGQEYLCYLPWNTGWLMMGSLIIA